MMVWKLVLSGLLLVTTLGILILALMLIAIATSAGFYFVRAVWGPEGGDAVAAAGAADKVTETAVTAVTAGAAESAANSGAVASIESVAAGRVTYMGHCAGCHPTDPEQNGYGPMLPGLFGRGALSSSGVAVTDDAVRSQILAPVDRMPSFEGRLDDEQLDDLIAYVKTL